TDTFTATVTDDYGASKTEVVTITVTGTNDSPVITTTVGQDAGAVRESGNFDNATADAGTPAASGTLTATDVDTGDHQTWSGSAAGTYGSLVITSGGAWTYTIANGNA